jgi:hypothetical protein
MKKLVILTILAFLCQVGIMAYAQTQFGTVTGRITDESEAVVANAAVKLTGTATGLSQTVASNEEGIYLLPNVAPGDYEMVVEVSGFHRYIHKLKMEVAERVILDVQLEVGAISEVLYVEEAKADINFATGDISTVMSKRDIEVLPLLNRNPYNLISLAPATTEAGAVAGDDYGVGITAGGARTRSINFMLDGGENNETFGAGVGQSVPQDAIEEFRLQTNNMTAEFGRNSVVANVVTKSGGNTFHGSAYEFYRGSNISAANFDDNATGTPKGDYTRNQFGGSFGGPIQKEKTFFFGSFEGILVRSSASRNSWMPLHPKLRILFRALGLCPRAIPIPL